ncbi:MAG: hypothetical protein ABI353_18730, partial [Isosphaeraceae bacterium]
DGGRVSDEHFGNCNPTRERGIFLPVAPSEATCHFGSRGGSLSKKTLAHASGFDGGRVSDEHFGNCNPTRERGIFLPVAPSEATCHFGSRLSWISSSPDNT